MSAPVLACGGLRIATPQPLPAEDAVDLTGFLDQGSAEAVRAFHAGMPGYEPTPLRSLGSLAKRLGLGALYVKDESPRFGLDAFKALGGSYAIARYLGERLGIGPGELGFDTLMTERARALASRITFVTATDGNHGRGVAWMASLVGARSVVYMPKGSAPERLAHIRAAGAEASICELNYDDAVRLAAEQAREQGWVMVQDTAWPGYEDIPRWIIQGYATMSLELCEQLPTPPTHVFVQAGVGSLAASVTGLLSSVYAGVSPAPDITVVEPVQADCVFRTAAADDGTIHAVGGDMGTIMAGLACGEPCTVAWPVLRSYARHFASCDDRVSALGMRVLGNPLPGDERVVSGESGAVTTGLVAALMADPKLAPARDAIGLGRDSVVVCLSTEGATDEAGYRRVVWEGAHPYDEEEV